MVQEPDKKYTPEEIDEEMSRNIRENIRRFRLEAGMTQAELAAKVGYADKSMIAKIESGKTVPPLDKLRAFANALDVKIFELVFSEEEISEMDAENEIWNAIEKKEADCELLFEPVVVPFLVDELQDTENLYAENNIYRHVAVPDWLKCDFGTSSLDNSMEPAGIPKYSEVFIQDVEPQNGELAAVLIDGENRIRIRRIYQTENPKENSLILQAAHPDYPPLVFTGEDINNVWILGKAVYVINELK